jgi:hypothetical protein
MQSQPKPYGRFVLISIDLPAVLNGDFIYQAAKMIKDLQRNPGAYNGGRV